MGAYWPKDLQTSTWWNRLADLFPDDPPLLRKACRGALLHHGNGLALDVACARAYTKYKRSIQRGQLRHRVYVVTGNEEAFIAEMARTASVRKSNETPADRRQRRARKNEKPPATSDAVDPEEARAELAKIRALLDDDD